MTAGRNEGLQPQGVARTCPPANRLIEAGRRQDSAVKIEAGMISFP